MFLWQQGCPFRALGLSSRHVLFHSPLNYSAAGQRHHTDAQAHGMYVLSCPQQRNKVMQQVIRMENYWAASAKLSYQQLRPLAAPQPRANAKEMQGTGLFHLRKCAAQSRRTLHISLFLRDTVEKIANWKPSDVNPPWQYPSCSVWIHINKIWASRVLNI